MNMNETKTRVTSVTVSVAAQVWVSQYRSFKPHASVTVAVGDGDTPQQAVELGIRHLRHAYFAALRTEIELVNETHGAMGPAVSVDDLLIHCEKELLNVAGQPSFRVEQGYESETGKKENPPVGGDASGGRKKGVRTIG